MEKTTESSRNIIIFLCIIIALGWYKYDKLQTKLEDYKYALDEANSSIEDAQSYAWSSYEDMGDTLENLETVNTVYEPN